MDGTKSRRVLTVGRVGVGRARPGVEDKLGGREGNGWELGVVVKLGEVACLDSRYGGVVGAWRETL